MLLQTLALIAIMLVVMGSLLTSSLVTAKASMQQTVTRHITAALTRGGGEATNWAQRYVATNGAAAQWPTTSQTDTPRPICAAQTATAATCPLSEVTVCTVVGSTAATTGLTGPDIATNLQAAVGENRISIVVTATIRGRLEDVVGTRSRRLTLRVFDAPPFAVVTGSEDSASTNGSIAATQGDTAGYANNQRTLGDVPSINQPAKYKDTTINVTISCVNSASNFDQSNALKDNHAPGNNGMPWGVRNLGFEAPCKPTFTPSPASTPPPNAVSAQGGLYSVTQHATNLLWSNRATTTNGWVK